MESQWSRKVGREKKVDFEFETWEEAPDALQTRVHVRAS